MKIKPGTMPPFDYFEEGTLTIIVKHKGKVYAEKYKLKNKNLPNRVKSGLIANLRRWFGENFIDW